MVLGMEIEEEEQQSIEEMKVSYALEEEKVALTEKQEEDWCLIECDESKNIGGCPNQIPKIDQHVTRYLRRY